MAEKDLSFEGFGAKESKHVFEQLSRLVMNNEITIGRDTGSSNPDGGDLAKLLPPRRPLEGAGMELLPPVSESQIAWAGGVGIGDQVRLGLIASNKR